MTTKSFAPSFSASTTFDSWPSAEHMTTRADGSAADDVGEGEAVGKALA